jgi:arsenate reductase
LHRIENAAATAVGLVAIIVIFGPVSGAHFNPVVSLADRAFGGLSTRDVVAYIPAQVVGCCAGAVLAKEPSCLTSPRCSSYAPTTPDDPWPPGY